MPPSTNSNRPVHRDLIRWNDDIDKGVMLTMQYVCAEAGIKLPWKRIAEVMGPKFSEGAIVQHLSKLRKRMIANHIPVPPNLKRGTAAKTPSKVYSNADNRHVYEPVLPLYADTPQVKEHASIYAGLTPITPGSTLGTLSKSPEPTPTKAAPRSALKTKAATKLGPRSRAKGRKRRAMSEEEDDNESIPELYDESEEEYISPPKKTKITLPRRIKVEKTSSPTKPLTLVPSTPAGQIIKTEDDEVALTEPTTPSGPATRTRGVKRNYAIMEDANTFGDDSDVDAINGPSTAVDEEEVPLETEDEVAEQDTIDNKANGEEHEGDLVLKAEEPQTNEVPRLNVSNSIVDMEDGFFGASAPYLNPGLITDPTYSMQMSPYAGGGRFFMPNINQQMVQQPYGAFYAPTPGDYINQGPDMVSLYDTSTISTFPPSRNNSVATSMTTPSRNSSVATGMPALKAYLPDFSLNTAEDLIGADNVESGFQFDDFIGDAMHHGEQDN